MRSCELTKKGNFYEVLDTNYTKGSVQQMMDRWKETEAADPSDDFLIADW